MRNDKSDVTVIGAGVVGLTTAVCLAEAGVSVAIHAAELPGQTTSVAAGAVWGPHLVGADERVGRWAAATLSVLQDLSTAAARATEPAGSDIGNGQVHPFVRLASGIAASRAANSEAPDFAADAASLHACAPDEIPTGYQSAWRLSAPLVSMPEYLDYLTERYLRAGGSPVTKASYPTLTEAADSTGSPVLVNCSGSGAHDLVPDPEITPVRGQVVVTSNPGLTEFFAGTGLDEGDLTYFFPHGARVVLGGTEQAGNWSREPDEATARRIVAACAAVAPQLRDAAVLGHRVGLRPYRPRVRLESVRTEAGATIVHNYGHGGAGVTLSWGCAKDAAELALTALGRQPSETRKHHA